MFRRLIAIATLSAPAACAGLLELDPGTLRAVTDGGPETSIPMADTSTSESLDAGPRGCSNALAPGVYCDDFDEPGRTDPSAREAKAGDAPEKLSLVDDVFLSPPRSLRAAYGDTGFPRAYLTTPGRTIGSTFHVTMALRVQRAGVSVGDPFIVAELHEVAEPTADGRSFALHLTPRQEAVELRLRASSLVLALHQKTMPYDEWHEVSMQFNGKNAYLELDGDAVSEGTAEIAGDYYVHFGLWAAAPVTVFLDNVELGP
jgi:hypothetical protein